MQRTIIAAIIIASVYAFLSMGFRQSFGLFMVPVTTAGLLATGTFSLAIAMQNLLWGMLAPVFGTYADRHGFVGIAFAGGVLYVLGLVSMAFADGAFGVLAGQLMIGVALAAAGMTMMLGMVGKLVSPQRVPIALGVVTATASFGQFAMIPFAQAGIDAFGWQQALLCLAAAATLMILLAPFLKTRTASEAVVTTTPAIDALRCALSNKSYIFLAVAFFVCGFQVVFIATHLPAYLTAAGHTSAVAAWSLSLIGMFNIAGTLLCGWLGSIYSKRMVLVWLYTIRAVVIAMFITLPQSTASVLLFGAVIGILWLGTVPLTSSLVSQFFGSKHITMLYGVVFLMHQLGSFCGALAGGLIYDVSGSYDIVWWSCVALGLLAAALHLPIRERQDAAFAGQHG